jgi:hypothetical protein
MAVRSTGRAADDRENTSLKNMKKHEREKRRPRPAGARTVPNVNVPTLRLPETLEKDPPAFRGSPPSLRLLGFLDETLFLRTLGLWMDSRRQAKLRREKHFFN